MFSRYTSSWELLKASASVLRSDKQLLVFPLVSAVASLFVTATFFIPAAMYAYTHHMFTKAALDAPPQTHEVGSQLHSVMGYVFMFMFYLAQYLVIFFANTALVGAALIRLRGGKPTVRDGFQLAMSHLGAIAGYALLSATVGMVIRSLSERLGFIGRMVMGFFGMAWNIATFLVAPVLIMENVGPTEGVKRSAALLKRTWGEQIIGGAGLNAAFGLIFLLVIGLFVPLFIGAASMESLPLALTLGVVFILTLTTLCLIQAALSGIYTAAVYLYASEGFTGGMFDPEMIRRAFRPKK